MAKYVNLTKRPLPVTASTGESFIIPPKGFAVLTPEQESSPSLVSLLSKGSLKRLADIVDEPAPVVIPPVERVALELPKLEKTEELPDKEEEKTSKKPATEKGIKKSL